MIRARFFSTAASLCRVPPGLKRTQRVREPVSDTFGQPLRDTREDEVPVVDELEQAPLVRGRPSLDRHVPACTRARSAGSP